MRCATPFAPSSPATTLSGWSRRTATAAQPTCVPPGRRRSSGEPRSPTHCPGSRVRYNRGVEVAHTTLFRWVQTYAPEIDKRIRPHLRPSDGSWRVDETYIRVKGRWMYLYRAVDSRGQTIDFLLSARRDAEAAKRFFRKALGQPHTADPRTITVDKNPAYPRAVAEMKDDGELSCASRLRQAKFLNNIIEQDHRQIGRAS